MPACPICQSTPCKYLAKCDDYWLSLRIKAGQGTNGMQPNQYYLWKMLGNSKIVEE